MKNSKTGELLVVATPIGNLEDMSFRAVRLLSEADLILAEDTRNALKLLGHYSIKGRLLSLHEHNESQRIPELISRLREGQCLALTSDAGTPLISDPGYGLVREAHRAGIPVRAVPGCNALVAALSVAGVPGNRFAFEGFPPAKTGSRRRWLVALQDEPRTLIFYESSHRILDSLRDMTTAFGAERPAAVARELTKKFETLYRGGLGELVERFEAEPNSLRGEFVVLVAAAEKMTAKNREGERALALLLEEGLPVRRASTLAANLTGANRNALYKKALQDKWLLQHDI